MCIKYCFCCCLWTTYSTTSTEALRRGMEMRHWRQRIWKAGQQNSTHDQTRRRIIQQNSVAPNRDYKIPSTYFRIGVREGGGEITSSPSEAWTLQVTTGDANEDGLQEVKQADPQLNRKARNLSSAWGMLVTVISIYGVYMSSYVFVISMYSIYWHIHRDNVSIDIQIYRYGHRHTFMYLRPLQGELGYTKLFYISKVGRLCQTRFT